MYDRLIGSRAQVYHGTAYKTKGGLTKAKLFKNKHGRYVSRKKHFSAKRKNNLIKHGFGFQKGKFGYVKLDEHKTRKHSRKHRGSKRRHMRGGFNATMSKTMYSPASYSGAGQGLGNSIGVQLAAGRGN